MCDVPTPFPALFGELRGVWWLTGGSCWSEAPACSRCDRVCCVQGEKGEPGERGDKGNPGESVGHLLFSLQSLPVGEG